MCAETAGWECGNVRGKVEGWVCGDVEDVGGGVGSMSADESKEYE